MRLAGRTAIVTGAGSGIGRASTVLFAKEGASVALVDRDRAILVAGEVHENVRLDRLGDTGSVARIHRQAEPARKCWRNILRLLDDVLELVPAGSVNEGRDGVVENIF